MNLTNLRENQQNLIDYLKESGYSKSAVYMYKRQIREILELDLDSWASYKDIYQHFVDTSINQKDLMWRRSIIGEIEHFDLQHLFPDRRRICSFIEPKGAYFSLNHSFQNLIDHYKKYAEEAGKSLESTIDAESHIGATFFYHLQQQGNSDLSSVKEQDILTYFTDKNGKTIRSFASCKSVKAVLKACVEIAPECERVLLMLPCLTEHRKNLQVLTDSEVDVLKKFLGSCQISLRDTAIMRLLLHTGMRGIDVANLSFRSLDWNKDRIVLLQSKTKAELELPLLPIVGNAIYDYIVSERPECTSKTVFVSEVCPYESLKVQTIRYIVRKVFKLAGIRTQKGDRIGTHLFRHNLTTKLLENDTALPVISNILGHTSPKSVDPYLHADFKHLKECALSINEFPIGEEVFKID